MTLKNLKTIRNFDLAELAHLYDVADIIVAKTDIRDLRECKKYMQRHLYHIDGSIAVGMFKNDNFVMVAPDIFKEQYYNRFPCKELKIWFKTSPEMTYFNLVCEKNKYTVNFKKKILYTFPTIKAKYSPYNTFSEDEKKACNKILDHIKTVNCGGKEDQYQHLLKIIKNMCNGVKNTACVVIRGIAQGTGKSTLTKFLEKHVIGRDNTCIGTSSMVVKGFNIPMYNKIMIKFEELPCFSAETYKGISSLFKTWITEDYINYEAKNKSSFDATNVHTMFILSNNDCLEDDDGRRYFIMDIDNCKKGQKPYFEDLYKTSFNDHTGNCFYSYLQDNVAIPEDFNASDDMPNTNNKMASIAQKAEKPIVFLKTAYVLQNKSINKKIKDLHNEYINTGEYYKMAPNTFHSHLKAVDLCNYIKNVGGYPKLKISAEELKNMYKKNNWIGELDEFESSTKYQEDEDDDNNDYIAENMRLKEEIEQLKKELAEIKKPIEVIPEKPVEKIKVKSEKKKTDKMIEAIDLHEIFPEDNTKAIKVDDSDILNSLNDFMAEDDLTVDLLN